MWQITLLLSAMVTLGLMSVYLTPGSMMGLIAICAVYALRGNPSNKQ